MLTPRRLAVWGDPIGHSRSPVLHAAAYAALGLDWTYERRRVTEDGFAGAIAALDASWRGLSLTMPLKLAGYRLAGVRDRHAELTGAVNTLIVDAEEPIGFNTDVGGIVGALRESGIDQVESARIIGTGATATSALVALHELGAGQIDVRARRPERADTLMRLGEDLGMRVTASGLDTAPVPHVSLTIAALPADAALAENVTDSLAAGGGTLFDVAYGTWPTVLGHAWQRAGLPASSGLGMLLHQALLQVRAFTTGDAQHPLLDEARVLAEMRRAVVGD
ncbi:shikimate dehydrogenase [Microbacterium sp. cx-59]|nr:shikimate dehydrogenase [Microbacterium sp. cx-59]